MSAHEVGRGAILLAQRDTRHLEILEDAFRLNQGPSQRYRDRRRRDVIRAPDWIGARMKFPVDPAGLGQDFGQEKVAPHRRGCDNSAAN
jgi:hypothetical protein